MKLTAANVSIWTSVRARCVSSIPQPIVLGTSVYPSTFRVGCLVKIAIIWPCTEIK